MCSRCVYCSVPVDSGARLELCTSSKSSRKEDLYVLGTWKGIGTIVCERGIRKGGRQVLHNRNARRRKSFLGEIQVAKSGGLNLTLEIFHVSR